MFTYPRGGRRAMSGTPGRSRRGRAVQPRDHNWFSIAKTSLERVITHPIPNRPMTPRRCQRSLPIPAERCRVLGVAIGSFNLKRKCIQKENKRAVSFRARDVGRGGSSRNRYSFLTRSASFPATILLWLLNFIVFLKGWVLRIKWCPIEKIESIFYMRKYSDNSRRKSDEDAMIVVEKLIDVNIKIHYFIL